MTIQSKVNWLIGLVVVLIALVALLFFGRVQPMRGYLKETAVELRRTLNNMNCNIWMLGRHPTIQHPYDTQTKPQLCPPGPPGLVPKDPP
jgi:hypothetical protein